jgi:hypothetical protein
MNENTRAPFAASAVQNRAPMVTSISYAVSVDLETQPQRVNETCPDPLEIEPDSGQA